MGLKNLIQNWKTKASSVKGEGDVDCVCFLCGRIAHHKYSTCGHNVNKQYYLEVIKHMQEAVKGKMTNSRWEKKWMLQNNNAPAHSFPYN